MGVTVGGNSWYILIIGGEKKKELTQDKSCVASLHYMEAPCYNRLYLLACGLL